MPPWRIEKVQKQARRWGRDKVAEAIRPTALKPEVLQWLNPQKRLACHFAAQTPPGG